MKRHVRHASLLIALSLLSACAAVKIPVFGDQTAAIDSFSSPVALKVRSDRPVAFRLMRGGRIYETGWIEPETGLGIVHLPPGQYRVTGLWHGNEFAWLESWHHPMVLFTVQPRRTSYPGTFTIRREFKPQARGETELMRVRLRQQPEEGALESIAAQFPKVAERFPPSYTGQPSSGPDR